MFNHITSICMIGLSDIIHEMIEYIPQNINILNCDDIDSECIKKADYIIARVTNTENLISVMKLFNKPINNLVLCMTREDFEKFNIDTVLDVWPYDITKKEMRYHFSKLLSKIMLEDSLYETQELLNTLINATDDLIWVKDTIGSHKLVNDSFLKTIPSAKDGHRKTREECYDRGHLFIWELSEEDYEDGEYICMESEIDVMTSNTTLTLDEKLMIGSGDMRNLMTKKAPLHYRDGSIMGTVGIAKDVTQEIIYKEKLKKNAYTDSLTGLYNRRYMYGFMEKNIKSKFHILFMDLDNFKFVNDEYGHNKGDEALIITANMLSSTLSNFTVGRLGGDEFIAVGKTDDIDYIKFIIKKEMKKINSSDVAFERLGISIGYAVNDPNNPDIEKLVHCSDEDMYKNKMINKSKNK